MSTKGPSAPLRRAKNRLFEILCFVSASLAVIPLLWIFGTVLAKGASVLSLSLFVELPKPSGEQGSGLANAILGSSMMVGLASMFALPVGLLGGIYLAERPSSKLSSALRLCSDVLSATPSIVVGLFVYTVVVVPMKRYSALAGSIALAVLMIPTLVRTVEELIRLVPTHLREASLALGANSWQTTVRVVLRTAAAGIATGVVLSVARVSGETAPLLFTALNHTGHSEGLDRPTASLTVQIYQYAGSPYADQQRLAWGAALILVVLIAGASLLTRVLIPARHSQGS